MDDWLHLLQAAAAEDRPACAEWSLKLGYLTGEENEVRAGLATVTHSDYHSHVTPQIMLNAHVDSMILLTTPFRPSTPQPFAFGPGSRWGDITGQIRANIPTMLQHRLTPPPQETYSLNRSVGRDFARCILIFANNISRKLSGGFLLASRLSAVVDAKRLWDDAVDGYQFGE